MQCTFRVQVYGKVLYIRFYSVFSEPFIDDVIFLWKYNPAHDKIAMNFNSNMEIEFS